MSSLRSKIVAFALLATLLPSLFFGLLSYVHDRGVVESKASQALQAWAAFASRQVELWLKERSSDLRVFASSSFVIENLNSLEGGVQHAAPAGDVPATPVAPGLRMFLRSVVEKVGHYSELLLADADGTVVASSTDTPSGLHLPQDWRLQIAENGMAIAEPHREEGNGRLVIMMAVPVTSAEGRLLGTLLAEIDLQRLGQAIPLPGKEEGPEVLVVDRDGQWVAGGDDASPGRSEGELLADTATSLWTKSGQLVEFHDAERTPVFGVLRPLPELPLAVLVQRPKAEVFKELNELRNLAAALIVAMLLLVGLAAYWFALSVVRPLGQMFAAAKRVAQGDLQVRVKAGTRDELGSLIRTFNEMVSRLRESREEIAKVNQELQEKNKTLGQLLVTDSLTGLRNRKSLLDTLELQMERFRRSRQPFSLLMLDIDHFKKLNDTYGHLAGDQVLRGIAQVLLRSVRRIDVAARYGGEEFLLLLFETPMPAALETAERIRALVAGESVTTDEGPLSVTVSIGVTEVACDDPDPNRTIQRADAALYRAKRGGRNRVCFTPVEQPATAALNATHE